MSGADEVQVVEFGLGNDVFAVPVACVREILDYAPPTPIPNGPPHFLGLTEVRGQGVATLDLRCRLALPPAQPTLATRILILDLAGAQGARALGVVVDRVISVGSFETAQIDSAPDIGMPWNNAYIYGVVRRASGFVVIVDIAHVLTGHEDAAFLSAMIQAA
ncbi:chemotaxis protein CheW [Novosphingobium profundi]|uniref:chemotaxis protein CheW n=1 Tax=Novosphingobium profundi TaxID=1774954 RepID=UPI001BDB3F52|nr:chemotaxis protein CheW [Novosphingobium profundi]MBT0671452.1 chemotaxis protein CheW [Novosphingobium profundi]